MPARGMAPGIEDQAVSWVQLMQRPQTALKAVPFVGQVVLSRRPDCAEVGRPAKILFLTIAALYVPHALSLGMLLGLLKKSGFVRP